MTKVFASLFRLDLVVHRNYFLAGLLVVPILVLLKKTSNAPMVPIEMLGLLVAPSTIAFWIVGNDRSKGMMALLASLPVPRWMIPWAKAFENCILTTFWVLWACAAEVFFSKSSPSIFGMALSLVTPPSIAACLLTTSAFFLFPIRVALYANIAMLAGLYLVFDQFLGLANSSSSTGVIIGLISICIASIALSMSANMWARRPSACE